MCMTDFDPTKPVQTRDGRPARIICDDRIGPSSIVALVTQETGHESPSNHHKDGRLYEDQNTARDLINIPEKRVVYVNVYPTGGTLWASRAKADEYATSRRVACVRVECTEGQYDD